MDEKLKRLIELGTLICGRKIEEDGIIRFERIDSSQIESIPEEERAYATSSMGRAVFSIDNEGKTHNYKGVDSHLNLSELGPMSLVNARAIEYTPDASGMHKISAVVFNNKKPEIRINGTSPLEDVEIEGDINTQMAKMGVAVPQIQYIREMPQDYSLRHGLPIKVPGDLSELESDYAKQDDERKARLELGFGDRYKQELPAGLRPETMKEYLERVGFFNSKELQEKVTSLGFTMETFVDAVDHSYSRGQRYGQAERIMSSPFRISDLETCINNGDKDGLSAIIDFIEGGDKDHFLKSSETFGKNIAVLINNGWECENLAHRQDFSVNGEFCDDSYFNIFEEIKEAKEKYSAPVAGAKLEECKRRYMGQVFHVASSIKVLQDSMKMIGKSTKEIDGLLEKFVDSFVGNLDFEKIGQVFGKDGVSTEHAIMAEFERPTNWVEKMAAINRREGIQFDDAIINGHNGNEDYYNGVSQMIYQRMQERSKQNESQKNTNTMLTNSSPKITPDDQSGEGR